MTGENTNNQPLIDVAYRKRIELEQKVKALEKELNDWVEKSQAGGQLEKHHTQIHAVRALLQPWHEEVRGTLNRYKEQEEADVFLGKCANAEKLILSEHRIWDFFRGKFIQRNVDTFNPYLEAADEFAWACYKPVQEFIYADAANARRKEPPLVFFNGGASPFSLSRDRAFQPETVAGETINLDSDTIGKLPIPVVGIPWHQINYLPEALVIGHEVGHIVEDDFGLTGDLKKLLDSALDKRKATPERRAAWHSWLGEVFADLYGCLASGAAFAGTLIDFLIKENELISDEEKSGGWGRYPTDYLRVKIVLRAMKVLGATDESKNYEILWENYTSKMSDEFSRDIEEIVPALLKGEYSTLRNKSISQIFNFSKNQQSEVARTVAALEQNVAKTKTFKEMPTRDIRVLLAALRTAFEKSAVRYVDNNYGQIVMNHIAAKVLKPGTRSGEIRFSGLKAENQNDLYKQIGENLLTNLL